MSRGAHTKKKNLELSIQVRHFTFIGHLECHELCLALITLLVSNIAALDNVGHFLFLLMQVTLQLLVDFIKDLALCAQVVDFFAESAVLGQSFVEFDEALQEGNCEISQPYIVQQSALTADLVEPVFEQLDLSLHSVVTL